MKYFSNIYFLFVFQVYSLRKYLSETVNLVVGKVAESSLKIRMTFYNTDRRKQGYVPGRDFKVDEVMRGWQNK